MRIHSILSNKCTVKTSTISGEGIFAIDAICKDEFIAAWGGVIYSKNDLHEICKTYPHFATHPFGVYKDLYMGPLDPDDPLDDAEKFNHSCNANAGVKGQIIVVATRNISMGEEICFDYETVETLPDALGFECHCGSTDCRKYIDGNAWKDTNFREKYRGYLSWYIQEMIEKEKHRKL